MCLSVMSGVEGSDYINATWLPGMVEGFMGVNFGT